MAQTLSEFGYLRVGVASPALRVADVPYNLEQMAAAVQAAAERQCRLLVFPELALTGYSCGDLFLQPLLIQSAAAALDELAAVGAKAGVALIVGLPVAIGDRLFNCAALLASGRLRGLVPKQFLPNSQEFYEKRWFAPAALLRRSTLDWQGQTVPVGTDLLFQAEGFDACRIGIEICEDAWAANPPSGRLAVQGATLLLNLSASPEILGKERYRRDLVCSQSARCLAAYAYASAGPGESTTDLVFSGHSLIAENGQLLAESERFSFATCLAVADVDLARLVGERLRNNSFADAAADAAPREVAFPLGDIPGRRLYPAGAGHALRPGPGTGAGRALPGDLRPADHRSGQAPAAHRLSPGGPRHLRRSRFDPGAAGYLPRPSTGSTCRAADRRGDHARFRHHRPHPQQRRKAGRAAGGAAAHHLHRCGGAAAFRRHRPPRRTARYHLRKRPGPGAHPDSSWTSPTRSAAW